MTTDALTESVLHLLYAFIGPTPLYVNCYLSNSNTGLLPTGLKQTARVLTVFVHVQLLLCIVQRINILKHNFEWSTE